MLLFAALMLLLVLFIGLYTVGPLLLIWSLNTLFQLDIAYTFTTWLAVLVIMMIIQGMRRLQLKLTFRAPD